MVLKFRGKDLNFLICFIFCAYNLNILIQNGQKVVYKNDENVVTHTHLSVCTYLNPILDVCSLIDHEIEELKFDACSKLRNLSVYFSKNNKSPQKTIRKAKEYEINKFFNFGNRTILFELYYLNFGSICVAYTINMTLESTSTGEPYFYIPIVNHFSINSKIVFHEEKPFPFITRFFFLECKQFDYCKRLLITIKKFNLIQLQYPFKSRCVNYTELKFRFENFEKIYSRSHCLMECKLNLQCIF